MKSNKIRSHRHPKIYVPTQAGFLYTLLAVILVPWVIYLAKDLPARHPDRHYDIAWVGLDIGLMVLLLITGFLATIKSRWVIIAASSTASFLLIDAWFDVCSSREGYELDQAIVLAAFVEIPLAIATLWLAYRVLNQNLPK